MNSHIKQRLIYYETKKISGVEAHYNKIKNDTCFTKEIKALCKKVVY